MKNQLFTAFSLVMLMGITQQALGMDDDKERKQIYQNLSQSDKQKYDKLNELQKEDFLNSIRNKRRDEKLNTLGAQAKQLKQNINNLSNSSNWNSLHNDEKIKQLDKQNILKVGESPNKESHSDRSNKINIHTVTSNTTKLASDFNDKKYPTSTRSIKLSMGTHSIDLNKINKTSVVGSIVWGSITLFSGCYLIKLIKSGQFFEQKTKSSLAGCGFGIGIWGTYKGISTLFTPDSKNIKK